MVVGQPGDDVWTSLRTLWREERWLPLAVPAAALSYALWIGATGAATSFLTEAVDGPLTIEPWTSTTTLVVVVLAFLWVLVPALLATLVVVDRVTNRNNNLRHGYRLRHPLVLLVPPAALLAAGYAVLVWTGEATWPLLAVLVAGAVWTVVRTLAYAYRVFSLSLPIVGWAIVFVTALVGTVATLVEGAIAAGREATVTVVATGLAELTGVESLATLHVETVAVDGATLPLLSAAVVAVPLGLSAAYVGSQLAWSVLVRLWRPTVRRPELRTGQRYPAFARPTADASGDGLGAAVWDVIGGLRARTGLQSAGRSTGASADDAPRSPSRQSTAGSGAPSSGRSAGRPATADRERAPGPARSAPDRRARVGSTDGGGTRGGAASTGETAESGGKAGDAPSGTDAADGHSDSAEDVSQTRVFTPPDDADLDATGKCPSCGRAVDAGADACPACGTAIDGA